MRARSLPPLPPQDLIRALHHAVMEYRSGARADDDETLMLFRPNGRAPRMSVKERVQSAARLLRALAQAIRPGGPAMPWPGFGVENIGGYFFPWLNRRLGGQGSSGAAD